jgi:hypothetical protein
MWKRAAKGMPPRLVCIFGVSTSFPNSRLPVGASVNVRLCSTPKVLT